MFQSRTPSVPRPTEQATELAWTSPTLLRDSVPDRIGRYRLGDRLGDGGTGTVHASIDSRNLQQLAIKVLRADRVGHRGARAAFGREAVLLGSLDHPGVPQLLDSGVTGDGRLWLVMERVEGRTLARTLASARYLRGPERRVLVRDVLLPAFVEACEVVAWAHRRGWLHRDLKPANVVLDPDGGAHVIDWGLAWPLDQPLPKRRSGVTGTPGYVSPEQLEHDRDASARMDVFALGAVLYEILTGDRAFGWARDREALRDLMAIQPAPPALLQPELPGIGALSRVCMDAISPTPERRPGIEELRDALLDTLGLLEPEETMRRAS